MRLYIDPGTGSMLFAILIGVIGTLRYLLKNWIVQLRFSLNGGKRLTPIQTKFHLSYFLMISGIGTYLSLFAVSLTDVVWTLYI